MPGAKTIFVEEGVMVAVGLGVGLGSIAVDVSRGGKGVAVGYGVGVAGIAFGRLQLASKIAEIASDVMMDDIL